MGAFSWLHFSPPSRQAGMPRPVGSGTNHAAVNLLPGHGAFTNTKEHGRRTPATATTEASSSFSARRRASTSRLDQTLLLRASSFTEPGSSGSVTGDRGGSGAAPERADCGDA